jgi:hypothetical protein
MPKTAEHTVVQKQSDDGTCLDVRLFLVLRKLFWLQLQHAGGWQVGYGANG